MKCKINRNAAKVLHKMLHTEEATGKNIRVLTTHMNKFHNCQNQQYRYSM